MVLLDKGGDPLLPLEPHTVQAKQKMQVCSVSDPAPFSPDPDQTFFPKSRSGSRKNPKRIRKNPAPDPMKNVTNFFRNNLIPVHGKTLLKY